MDLARAAVWGAGGSCVPGFHPGLGTTGPLGRFDRCSDAGPYAREIRYGADAVIPPLRPDQDAWAERILQTAPT